MSAFQAQCRAAAVAFLTDYASSAGVRLQVYPGRPRSINPPTGFVDALREMDDFRGPVNVQRVVEVTVLIVHGTYDSADSAAQKDAFADGLIDFAKGYPHQAAANTEFGITAMEDLPAWAPDWVPPEAVKTYYATSITLRGLAFE